LNRLVGGGGPRVEGLGGEGEGEGCRGGAPGRVLRAIRGGPLESGCDLAALDGEWVDRRGGGGGGGRFDLGSGKSWLLEELFWVRRPMSAVAQLQS